MKNTLIILILSLSLNLALAQKSDTDTLIICQVNKQYIKSLATDAAPLLISPIHWSRGEWFGAGAVVGSALALYSQDKAIADFWQKNQTEALDKANEYFFDPLGKMYYTIPLMGAFYIYGTATHKNKPKRVAMDFVQASLYSGVIVTVMKHLAHRHRPYQTSPHNPYLWDGPATDDWDHTSFPSGHTIMTFTFAAVVGTHYRKTIWVPIVVYSLATLEGMARMYDDKHWSTDVLIGGALGYAIGTFVVNRNHCKLKTIPIISSNFTGLSFTYPI
jgi:membrane-associated phospholipid phosphatase